MKNVLLSLILTIILTQLSFANENKSKIDVLYFHATIRCHACLTIEEYTRSIVNTRYQKELQDSTITIQSIDFLEEGNEHFQDDYQFDTQTLILSKKVDGKEVKWKNLTEIWDHYSDFSKFEKYITEEINKFLKEL